MSARRHRCGAENLLREAMTSIGDRWSDEQMDELLNGVPLRIGQLLYPEFTKQLKSGTQDLEDLVAPVSAPVVVPYVLRCRPHPRASPR